MNLHLGILLIRVITTRSLSVNVTEDTTPVASCYFVFCFGITYDCVKRVQASNNTLLDKPVNGVACPSNVESEAPNMRIDIQKRNMQHPSFSESELELNSPRRIVLCCSVIRS